MRGSTSGGTHALSLRARDKSTTDAIWEFYQRHDGDYDSFLFENPNDSSSDTPVSNDVFATGDGTETVFYVGNKFSLPTGDCYLLSGTASVEKSIGGTGDYAAQSDGIDYNLTASVGQIAWIGGALDNGDVLRASYRFYYTVRFKESELTRSAFAYLLWDYGLELVQII